MYSGRVGRPRYEGGGGDRNLCLSCLAPPGDSASGSRLSSKQGLFPSGSVPRSLFFEDNCCTHRACHPKFMLWDTVFMENEQAESLVSYPSLSVFLATRSPMPHATIECLFPGLHIQIWAVIFFQTSEDVPSLLSPTAHYGNSGRH